MAFEYDLQAFPLLWCKFIEETTADDAKAFADMTDAAVERARSEGVKLAVLCDCLTVGKAEAAARQQLATYSKYLSDEHGDLMAPAVVLISNPLVRGAMTAVGWVAPKAVNNTKVAKDADSGFALVRSVAADDGVVLDEAAVQALIASRYAAGTE